MALRETYGFRSRLKLLVFTKTIKLNNMELQSIILPGIDRNARL